MSRAIARNLAMALAGPAAAIFAGVTLTELNYIADHPDAYGPAKVVAWGAGAGVLLSVAVALLAYSIRPAKDY